MSASSAEDEKMAVHISLLSGKSVTLECSQDESITCLKRRAQQALGLGGGAGGLISAAGDCLNATTDATVKRMRIMHNDTLTLSCSPTKVQVTEKAFAVILGDASVACFGTRLYGGDSSALQDQLVSVQHVAAAARAFAAIRGDGTVVTWGRL